MKINPIYCQPLNPKSKANQNNNINRSAVTFTGPVATAEQELVDSAIKFAKGDNFSLFPLLLRDTKLPEDKATNAISDAIKSLNDVNQKSKVVIMDLVKAMFVRKNGK